MFVTRFAISSVFLSLVLLNLMSDMLGLVVSCFCWVIVVATKKRGFCLVLMC
jgi:hypothetical protein